MWFFNSTKQSDIRVSTPNKTYCIHAIEFTSKNSTVNFCPDDDSSYKNLVFNYHTQHTSGTEGAATYKHK